MRQGKEQKKKMIDFPDDAEIVGEYGQAIIPKGKTGLAINPRYFAARVVERYGLVFFKTNGWYVWSEDGRKPCRECILRSRISKLLDEEVRAYSTSAKQSFTQKTPMPTVPAFDLVNTGNINEVMRTMKYMCDRGNTLPPLDPDVIPVQNGLLRWNAEEHDFEEFRKYTQDDLVFYTLDVVYDSEAKSALFDKSLSEILPDSEDRCVVQEYMGAVLFSENRTRKFMSFTGESGSGKSVLVGLLSKIMTPVRNFDLEIKDLTSDYGLSALTTPNSDNGFGGGER